MSGGRIQLALALTAEERREVGQELHAFADRLGREKSPGAKKRAGRMREIAAAIGGFAGSLAGDRDEAPE